MHPTVTAVAPTATLRGLWALARPRQWIKNGFVLAPLVFTGAFVNRLSLLQSLAALLLFCLASSASYIVNDLRDIDRDRSHPLKRHTRPLASGAVSRGAALALLAVLYALLAAAAAWQPAVMGVIAAYLLLNLAYSFWLKELPVVDIFTIAIGFVLRVYAGATALSVPVSGWMFVTTLCLALFLASIKRRQELLQAGTDSRAVLKRYSPALADRFADISGTSALLSYSMFVMSARPELVVSVPLVLFGLFRYWYVVEQLQGGESPTDALLQDWPLLLCVLAWVATCLWALWPR